ncbi:hypothetical protein [Burkholderia gladioli]|uniref:hypothetical protein n=1 Tax=Burkholderia gladioli TaxID=28095 RepID=UPI0016408D6E|nr:hypothetical protein [Burkholderia gladioli]
MPRNSPINRILAFLADGPKKRSAIAGGAGIGENVASELLDKMAGQGSVSRIKSGTHRGRDVIMFCLPEHAPARKSFGGDAVLASMRRAAARSYQGAHA